MREILALVVTIVPVVVYMAITGMTLASFEPKDGLFLIMLMLIYSDTLITKWRLPKEAKQNATRNDMA